MVLLSIMLVGCGLICASCASAGKTSSGSGAADDGSPSTPLPAYTALYATYDADTAPGDQGAFIDTSSVASGYVGAAATSDAALKFQVKCGDETYNYDLPSDGTPAIFPINCGNGTYTFRVMKNTTADKYIEIYATTIDVTLDSEFEPFLRNNQMVAYSADSACVAKADELRGESSDELELAGKIFDYVTTNVDYDYDKAATVQSGYIPDPDTTLLTGKGICFDYATLSAAMLRSQGIPCKVITGYVEPDGIYHAWDIVYFKETGWITVQISVENGQWKRLDTTMAATEGGSGESTSRTYTDRFVY